MADYTRMLAQLVADTSYEDLPDEVVDRAKTVMMDTLSCAVAGYTKAPEECGWLIRIAKEMGGAPESTVSMDTRMITGVSRPQMETTRLRMRSPMGQRSSLV